MLQARKLTVTAVKGSMPIHCDGETVCYEGSEITIELVPSQIDFITQAPA